MRTVAVAFTFILLVCAPAYAAAPTYGDAVASVLNRRCVSCHRPGGTAPMSLLGYEHVRPYAKAIRDEVVAHTMPPWYADPRFGHFANDARLSEDEIATIVRWVAGGAPRGTGAPHESFHVAPGWAIGAPDHVVSLPRVVEVPAKGEQPNLYLSVPSGLAEDRWVSAMEIRPGNPSVLHHITVFVETPRTRQLPREAAIVCTDPFFEEAALRHARERAGELVTVGRRYLYSWTPGTGPLTAPSGGAILLPAGSSLVFEMHYVPKGKATTDRSAIGFRFAKAPPTLDVSTLVATNESIGIPPGASNYEASACLFLTREVTLLAIKPHMHLRGKDILFEAEFPSRKRETLLSVPRWNFDWQLTYKLVEPQKLPAGTRVRVIAHYDNSSANKRNPDPTRFVVWDNQSTGEMLAGMMTVSEPHPP
jgi:mono/diheme cytochrome c family protein